MLTRSCSNISLLLIELALLLGLATPVETQVMPGKCQAGQRNPGKGLSIPQLLTRPTRHTAFISADSTFAIHYDTMGVHSPDMTSTQLAGIPDWVVEVVAALDSTRRYLLALGFDPALSDGDDIYDVYLQDYGGLNYGETFMETQVEGNRWITYMILDNDYAGDEAYYTHGLNAARATVAHNYFHAVQMTYGLRSDDIFLYEISATWFEEIVFPEANDWLYWYSSFRDDPTQAIQYTGGYPVAFFGHYLTTSYGIDIMRQIWERFRTADGMTALGESILSSGGDMNTSWVDCLARLYCNGRRPEYYFHPDQDSLDPPVIPSTRELEDSLRIVHTNLQATSAVIEAVIPLEDMTFGCTVYTDTPTVALGAVLDSSEILSLRDIAVNELQSVRLDSGDRMILIASGELDSLIIDLMKVENPVAVRAPADIPGGFHLHQNYPNPFNPVSTLRFDLSVDRDVTLIVYDLMGTEVARLVDEGLPPGQYHVQWNGRDVSGRILPSGIYIARLMAPDYSQSIKMVLLK